MPAIYVEWLPHYFPYDAMLELCGQLEEDLRNAIKTARPPVNHEYKVMIRGNPHPNIVLNVPDLEVRIEYHAEWEFTPEELDVIASEMASAIESHLEGKGFHKAEAKLRFYSRTGYKGVDMKFG